MLSQSVALLASFLGLVRVALYPYSAIGQLLSVRVQGKVTDRRTPPSTQCHLSSSVSFWSLPFKFELEMSSESHLAVARDTTLLLPRPGVRDLTFQTRDGAGGEVGSGV